MSNLFMPKEEKRLDELLDRPEDVIPNGDVSWPDEWIVFASNSHKFRAGSVNDKFQIWLLPNFNMNPILLTERSKPVKALCIHEGRLYDSGCYGVYDTLDSKFIVNRGRQAVKGLCSHDGVLYDCGNYAYIYDTLNDKKVICHNLISSGMASFNGNFYYAYGENVYGVHSNKGFDLLARLFPKFNDYKMKIKGFRKHMYGHANMVTDLCVDDELMFSFSRESLDLMFARTGVASNGKVPSKDPHFFKVATNYSAYGLLSHGGNVYDYGQTVAFSGKMSEVYSRHEPFEFKDTITAMVSVPRSVVEVHLDE